MSEKTKQSSINKARHQLKTAEREADRARTALKVAQERVVYQESIVDLARSVLADLEAAK